MEYLELMQHVLEGGDLGEHANELARNMFDGVYSDLELAAILTGIQARGASGRELAAFAEELRSRCLRVSPISPNLVDTCGTGGGLATFNLSTAAVFVAAGAEVRMAKHGNRAVTSRCGSADVLIALGAELISDPARLAAMIDTIGVAFLFAPNHHPAMAAVGPVRKALRFRTIFNQLGPLANPAGVRRQVLGVYSPNLLEPLAEALQMLGTELSLVVHGSGLDEVSPCGSTQAIMVEGEHLARIELEPRDFGIDPVPFEQIAGGRSAEESAWCVRQAVSDLASVWAQSTIPSAAAAIFCAGMAHDWLEAADIARESIRSGGAQESLAQFIKECNAS